MTVCTETNSSKKVLLIGAIGFILVAFVTIIYNMHPIDSKANLPRVVTIPAGSSTAEIGRILTQERAIRNPEVFRILTRVKKMDNQLKAGEYEFTTGMTMLEILKKIAAGETVTYTFTIPEGYTVEQIATLLAEKKLANRERFLELARRSSSINNQVPAKQPGYAVEGFLFPDTYKITRGMKEEEILAMMLAKFEETVAPSIQAKISGQTLTTNQILTLASLVEREARAEAERPIIAAVFLHRLRIDMPLQSCATIQYILGMPKKELTVQDTQIESPYNTYLHPGLPPGPIANPGLPSVQAVLNPAKTDVLFFVAKPDGTHIFSKTYEEHLRAIDKANI